MMLIIIDVHISFCIFVNMQVRARLFIHEYMDIYVRECVSKITCSDSTCAAMYLRTYVTICSRGCLSVQIEVRMDEKGIQVTECMSICLWTLLGRVEWLLSVIVLVSGHKWLLLINMCVRVRSWLNVWINEIWFPILLMIERAWNCLWKFLRLQNLKHFMTVITVHMYEGVHYGINCGYRNACLYLHRTSWIFILV